MDRRRLALIRGGEEGEFRRIGSGYLVAPRLVLTARHVVEKGPGRSWPRIDVRVGHPQDGTRRCAARVCWTHPDGRDVALLLLDDSVDVPGEVRWGAPAGNDPLPYDALGFPSATVKNGQYTVEHLRGELPVLSGGVGEQDLYVLDQGPAPGGAKAWAGASGSAVFCRDRLVGVVVHDDEAFENRRLHACPARSFVEDPAFTGLLERHGGGRPWLSPVGTDLERYLRAARLAATEHPYPGVVPGVMPPLSQVYVRQRVVRLEALPTVSASRPADEVLTGAGTCLLIGGPGVGKSSLLRTRLAHGAAEWLDGPSARGPAPVLVPAAALQGAPLSRALVEAVNAQLPQYGLTTPLPDAFFDNRPGPGRDWLVLVDGLDEITDPAGRKDVLRIVAHAGDQYVFVVTSRPVPEAEPGVLGPEVPRYALEPFRPDELERVARGWFHALGIPGREHGARQFLTALDTARLTELARVPLTMSMLCQLRAEAPENPLPRGRGAIYGDFVELLHERQYAAGAVPQARAALRRYGSDAEAAAERTVQGLPDVLADLAHRLLFAQHGDRPVLDIVRDHPCAARPKAVPERHWRDFLESVVSGTGLLTRRSHDLAFTHRTFVEYFAARHVIDDEARLRAVFRRTYIRPARCLPGSEPPPGIKPRRWGIRYWKPPRNDPYDGFLLDITPEDHPLRQEFLGRMASRRAGLDGFEFLNQQVRLGTSLPEDVIATTVRLLHECARDRSLDGYHRVIAALMLTETGEADGVALTREFAHDKTLDSLSRALAATELGNLGLTEAAELLHDVAQDPGLDPYDRAAAEFTAFRLGPPRERIATALKLAESDAETAGLLLLDIAQDVRVDSSHRERAARELTELRPDGIAGLLERLALDSTMDGFSRLWAAERLLRDDPQRGRTVLRALHNDTTFPPSLRHRAAVIYHKTRAPDPE
ncbi:trypsin-like peptidase domain-containing protein [Streptomyces sp. NPDC051987]|uniref:trypsin-like peptidase domain-containing protein n=1 Tax=Streptomyces sp. NPDC051987 TaxID=3155808 RepID=UPI003414D21E